MDKKSQAGLEFLTTYGWALFVVIATVTALYYFGIFDFGNYLPQKCTFPLQFKCVDFSLQPGQVNIKLANNIGEYIIVDSMQITSDAANPVTCTPPVSFGWDKGEEKDIAFTACSGEGYIRGERTELKVSFIYHSPNTPSQPLHTVRGKINGKVLP